MFKGRVQCGGVAGQLRLHHAAAYLSRGEHTLRQLQSRFLARSSGRFLNALGGGGGAISEVAEDNFAGTRGLCRRVLGQLPKNGRGIPHLGLTQTLGKEMLLARLAPASWKGLGFRV